MPRYWIEAPGTGLGALAQLRAVEGVLGRPVGGVPDSNENGPWEIGTGGSGLPASLIVDLQPLEAVIVRAGLPHFKTTKRLNWDVFFAHEVSDDYDLALLRVRNNSMSDSGGDESGGHVHHQVKAGTPDPPDTSLYPFADSAEQSRAEHLNFLSRPKAEDYRYNIHRYHSSLGGGVTIFYLDSGFTTAQYEGPGGGIWRQTSYQICRAKPLHNPQGTSLVEWKAGTGDH